ncbi:hypothetical protein ACUDCK_19790 [Achromobacter sp. CF-sbj1-Ac2-l]|uniref:hypothetical protein n=1 Tax=Achromobacter TaxID=222 RepID=UPI0015835F37|nr:hypothetical protein [Achromobacter dolens]
MAMAGKGAEQEHSARTAGKHAVHNHAADKHAAHKHAAYKQKGLRSEIKGLLIVAAHMTAPPCHMHCHAMHGHIFHCHILMWRRGFFAFLSLFRTHLEYASK